MTRLWMLVLCVMIAGSARAQAPASSATRGPRPSGWKNFLDHANVSPDFIRFEQRRDAMYVGAFSGSIFFNPILVAPSGEFSFGATFEDLKPKKDHPEGYGLIWGGADLDTVRGTYWYFLIRGDGSWLLKRRRTPSDIVTIAAWTKSPLIHTIVDANTPVSNALEVRLAPDSVRLLANGKRLAAFPAKELGTEGGLTGFRVNANLTMNVRAFGKR